MVTEDLGDDQFIATFNGREYRMIGAEKVAELAKGKVELATCKSNESRFQQLIENANKDVIIAEQQRDIERGNFVRVMALYERERELRTETMQFIPHGKVSGLGGKFLNFLDGPVGQSLFKLVIPTAQFVKVMKQ